MLDRVGFVDLGFGVIAEGFGLDGLDYGLEFDFCALLFEGEEDVDQVLESLFRLYLMLLNFLRDTIVLIQLQNLIMLIIQPLRQLHQSMPETNNNQHDSKDIRHRHNYPLYL